MARGKDRPSHICMLNNGGCLIWHKVPGDLALELQRIGCKEKAQKTMLVDPMTQHRAPLAS